MQNASPVRPGIPDIFRGDVNLVLTDSDDATPDKADCWAAFWEVIGPELYRLWLEDQTNSTSD
jgi:hypothetical protein